MMQTLVAKTQLDIIVKKSLFRVHAAPIASEDDANDFIERWHQADATHNCWAWRLDQRYRSFDDGEPGGTAGRPILQAIDSQTFDRVAILVVRWFGGIKLGAGGLARAYGGAAAACLKQGDITDIVLMQRVSFQASFSLLPIIQARLVEWGARQESCTFNHTGAKLEVSLPMNRTDAIFSSIQDLLRGSPVKLLATESEGSG